MDSGHSESQSIQSGDVNEARGTLTSEATLNYNLENLSSEHERVIENPIGGRMIFPREQKSPSGSYPNQEGVSAFLQDSSDSTNISSGVQLKVNGVIGRKGNYGSTSGKHALRQQARRRRRNTSIAAGNSPPITRVTMKSGAPGTACSPSGASPTRNQLNQGGQSSAMSSQCQHSPYAATLKQSSKQSFPATNSNQLCSFQMIEGVGIRESHIPSDNLARIIISKINCDAGNMKSSLEPNISYPLSDSYYLDNNRGLFQGRDTTVLQCTPPAVRSSSRLAGSVASNSSSAGQTQIHPFSQSQSALPSAPTTTSSTQSNRTLRVCAPQSSPSTRDSSSPSMTTMQCYLASIPGFKPRKRSQRKLSTAAQLAQTKEGNVDLETPDSILVNVNLKSLINVETFSVLPPSYQHQLAQLLPQVDQVVAPDNTLKVISTGFHNEFLARACVSWRERLSEGEFTHDNQVKLKGEAEKERSKLDPWKVAHFEPVWGMKQSSSCEESESEVSSPLLVSVGEENESSLSSSSTGNNRSPSPLFTDLHMKKLTKVVEFIAFKEQRRRERREARRLQRQQMEEAEREVKNEDVPTEGSLPSSSSVSLDESQRLGRQETLVSSNVREVDTEEVRSLKNETSVNLKRKVSPVTAVEHVTKKLCPPETVARGAFESKLIGSESGVSVSKKEFNVVQESKPENEQTNKILQIIPSIPSICVINCSNTATAVASNYSQPQVSSTKSVVTSALISTPISVNRPSSSILSICPSSIKSRVESSAASLSSVIQTSSQFTSKLSKSSTSSVISKLNSQGVNVCAGSSSALVGHSFSPHSSTPKKLLKGHATSSPASSVTLRISKGRSHDGVNLQRSYEIVQGVIANSPNREQLATQLKPHTVLLAPESKTSSLSSKLNSSLDSEKEASQVESSSTSSLSITPLSSQPAPEFATPKGISTTAAQTLTVLKALPGANGHFTQPFPQNNQSHLGQLLPTGQRVFRSVALPLAAISTSGSAMMIRPVVPSQPPPPQAPLDAASLPSSSASFAQTLIKEGSKTAVSTNGPITILRPAAGGKPVFLRTLSVSNVHLVRVSEILNGRADGDAQQPPRASSAPPTRNSLVTVPSVVPRPSSVGPRILIPTSSPAHPAFIPSSPGPSRHFLSEGDPSSGVSNCGSVDDPRPQADATKGSQRGKDSVALETRAGARLEAANSSSNLVRKLSQEKEVASSHSEFCGLLSSSEVAVKQSDAASFALAETKMEEKARSESERFADLVSFSTNNTQKSSLEYAFAPNVLESRETASGGAQLNKNDFQREDLSEMCNGMAEDSSRRNSQVSLNQEGEHNSDVTTDETCSINEEMDTNEVKDEDLSPKEAKHSSVYHLEPNQDDAESSFNESFCEKDAKEFKMESFQQEEQQLNHQEGTALENQMAAQHLSQGNPHSQSCDDYQPNSNGLNKVVESQQQQCFHQQNPYIVQQQANGALHQQQQQQQQMMQKHTYYIQQHPGTVAQQQGNNVHSQNMYQNVPGAGNVINNFHPVDNQTMPLNIHTFTNVNNNQVMNTAHPVNMEANMMAVNGTPLMSDPNDASQQTMSLVTPVVGNGLRRVAPMDNCEEGNNKNSNTGEEGCPCNMRAMVACLKCGAFCHHDCISPSRLCLTCLIR